MACLVAGCEDNSGSSNIKNLIKEKGDFDATLIHKENYVYMPKEGNMTSAEIFYYFDTDNNPETAEFMLMSNNHANSALLNSFNKAKIGKTQKISEWHNDLVDKRAIYVYYEQKQENQKQ